jgi:beta-N-acetylhexosaminidase
MRRNEDFRAAVRRSVVRVLRIKIDYLKGENAFPLLPDPQTAAAQIPAPGATEFFFNSALRSVTAIRRDGLPFTPAEADRVLIVSQYASFLEEGRRRYPRADVFEYDWESPRRFSLPTVAASYDAVVFHLSANLLDYSSYQTLRSLENYPGAVHLIVSFAPVLLDDLEWVDCALAVYGDAPITFRAGFAVLAGDFEARGTLPIEFSTR